MACYTTVGQGKRGFCRPQLLMVAAFRQTLVVSASRNVGLLLLLFKGVVSQSRIYQRASGVVHVVGSSLPFTHTEMHNAMGQEKT